jgi:hypothetical protein
MASNIRTNGCNYPTIYYQNVRGLRSKTLTFYRKLNCASYDIIFLTETWLLDGILNSELFDDRYVVWRRDRDPVLTGQSRGGGVIIATRRELTVVPQPTYQSSAEDLWVTLSLKGCHNTPIRLHMCVLYLCKQNNGFSYSQQLSIFLDSLSEVILLGGADKYLIIGDFNMSNIMWTPLNSVMSPSNYISNDECTLIDELNTCNLSQFNGILNQYGKLLDLVLSNDSVDVSECTDPLVPIDPYHKALLVTIRFVVISPLKPAPSIKYFYNKGDYDSINNELAQVNWREEFSRRSLDDSLDYLYSTFVRLRTKYIPSKNIHTDSFPKWYSASLKKAIREKFKYLKKTEYMVINPI